MAPSSLLQPCLSRSRGALAVLACRSNLQSHRPRQGTPPRTGPTLSRAVSAAAISSCRAGGPNTSHRAGFAGDRSPDHVRFEPIIPAVLAERRPAPSRNSAENSCGLPCSRPGCYVLFLPSPRSPGQHFCSGSCRQALRRVRQREARLRRRRRRGMPGRSPPSSWTAPDHSVHVAASLSITVLEE